MKLVISKKLECSITEWSVMRVTNEERIVPSGMYIGTIDYGYDGKKEKPQFVTFNSYASFDQECLELLAKALKDITEQDEKETKKLTSRKQNGNI